MPAPIDITNKTFGRLKAVRKTWFRKDGRIVWLFSCDCGNKKLMVACRVASGSVMSCGCLKSESDAIRLPTLGIKHGHASASRSPTYISWRAMKKRAATSDGYYKDISMCERWNKFENFLADMGDRPDGHTIDRINNDLPYSPENCRWATITQQNRNKKNVHVCYYGGKQITVAELALANGITPRLASERMRRGWSPIDAATKPRKIDRRK